MTLAEVKEEVDHISETWRGGTAEQQRVELAQLDDALAELDDIYVDNSHTAEAVDDLRGRIEILMDEIEISLGLQPASLESTGETDLTVEELELADFEDEEELDDQPRR